MVPQYYTEACRINRLLYGGNVAGIPPVFYNSGMRMTENFEQLTSGGHVQPSWEFSSDLIHMAALRGEVNVSQMKRLVSTYGVNCRDFGRRPPLLYAVLGDQPQMCEILLKLRATVNTFDIGGITPLLWATYQSKPAIVAILLK